MLRDREINVVNLKSDFLPEYEVERITLEQMRLGIKRAIPKTIFSDVHAITADAIIQRTSEDMILSLNAMVTCEKLTEIKYPASWVQAVKERFLPAFILDRFPVKYINYDAVALYSNIALRHQQEVYLRFVPKNE